MREKALCSDATISPPFPAAARAATDLKKSSHVETQVKFAWPGPEADLENNDVTLKKITTILSYPQTCRNLETPIVFSAFKQLYRGNPLFLTGKEQILRPFYLRRSRQIRERKELFFLLLLLLGGGDHFSVSHVQFFGV